MYQSIDSLVFEILKELYNGKIISGHEVEERVKAIQGTNNQKKLRYAWDHAFREGFMDLVDPHGPTDGHAPSKITDYGKITYELEIEKREAESQKAEEEKSIRELSKKNLWYTSQNAKDAFEDYSRIKSDQLISKCLAIGSAIVSLIALFRGK